MTDENPNPRLKIVDISQFDAFYPNKDRFIGLTGTLSNEPDDKQDFIFKQAVGTLPPLEAIYQAIRDGEYVRAQFFPDDGSSVLFFVSVRFSILPEEGENGEQENGA